MKRTIKLFSLLLFMGVFFTACSDDDPTTSDPDPDPAEAESAIAYRFRIATPQGEINYIDVAEEIPSEPDVAGAVELGIGVGSGVVGDNVYTINGSAGTITKWDVDRTTLELSVSGLLSFASVAAGARDFTTVFLSETEAYLPNFEEGIVLEFNPEAMEITKVHNVSTAPVKTDVSGFKWPSRGAVINGKPAWTFGYFGVECCDFDSNVPFDGALIAIWDPATESLEYKTDPRMLSSDNQFVFDENGSVYIQPNRDSKLVAHYLDGEPTDKPIFNLLRLDDNGNFDPNFSFNIGDAVPDMQWYSRASFIFDNKIVINYAGGFEWAEAYDDRNDYRDNLDNFRSIALDLNTGEEIPFDALDEWAFVAFRGNIEGSNYFLASIDGRNSGSLIRQDGFDTFTTVMVNDQGLIAAIDKLW